MRTAQSRTFRGGGVDARGKKLSGIGYSTRVYSAPVNYQDGAGVWQKIDTTMRATTGGWSDATNPSADVLAPATLGTGLTVGGPSGVGFTLRGAADVAGRASGSEVRYPAAWPGVDVIQRAVPSGVQELFVLDGPTRQATFTTDVTLPPGGTLTARDGGAVIERNGTLIGSIPAPTVTDASGAGPEAAASMTVTGSSVTVSIDPVWLADPARVFPVELDPDFYAYGTSATIKSTAPTTNFSGTGSSICAGWDNTGSSSPTRGLVKFPNIGVTVPPNAEIVQSIIGGHVTQASPAATVAVYPLTRALDTSTVTWNQASTGVNWTTAGGDYKTTEGDNPQLVNTVDPTNVFHQWALNPDIAQGWLRSGGQTGFMFKVANEAVSSKICMTGSTDPWVGPYLNLTWQYRTGMRPGLQYFDRAISDHEAVHVNLSNGNLVVTSKDFSAPAPGIPVGIYRTWNLSHAYQVWQNGYGWYQAPGESGDFSTTASEVYSQYDGTAFKDPATQGGAPWQPWHLKDYTYTGAQPYGVDRPPPGVRAASSFDGSGNRIVTNNTTGAIDTITTASNGQTAKVTDRNGNVMTINHSGVFTPVNDTYPSTVVDTAGRTWTFNHTTANTGFYTTITGPVVGGATPTATYTYSGGSAYTGGSSDGQLLTATDSAGGMSQYQYDGNRRITKITSPAGRQTTFTYATDPWGSSGVASMTLVENTGTGAGKTFTFSRGAYSTNAGGGTAVATVTDPLSHTTSYTFNPDDQAIKVVDPLGRQRSKTYGPDSNVTTAVDALGIGATSTSTYSYDTDNRSSGSTAPNTGSSLPAAQSTLTYAEAVGPVTSRVNHWLPNGGTDPNGMATSFTYDGPGNLSTSSTAAPTGAVVKAYTYNPPAPTAPTCGGKPGQVCTVTDGRLNVTSYAYNSSGSLTTVTPPSPLPASTFTYDTLGRTATKTDGKAQISRYTYDLQNRLTKIQYAGATTCTSTDITNKLCITFSYDADGNHLNQIDNTGTTTYTYDTLGRESTRSVPGHTLMTLTYDGAGNVATVTNGTSGTTTYAYNNANELSSLAEPGGSCTSMPTVGCTTFGYNANGLRTSTTYPTAPNSTVMTVTPDNSGRVKQIRTVNGATVIADFSYAYDYTPTGGTAKDGNLTTKRVDNKAALTTTYGYDTLDRLTAATEKNSSGTTLASWTYGYDKAGNRTSATIAGVANTFSYNNADQLTTRNGSGTGFSYDNNGNETAAVGASTRTAETWNSHDQLTSATVAGTATAYTYTGLGQGTRNSVGGTTFRNSQTGITQQSTNSIPTDFVREPSGNLIAARTSSVSYYYVYDGLGSVVALVNATGTAVNTYSYDPYGISRAKTEATTNPWQYTGGYLDNQTNLYKLGIRYYDPTLGRFTQADPTGQDPHYTYAGNRPTSATDPSGAGLLDSLLNGATAGGIIDAISQGDFGAVADQVIGFAVGSIVTGGCLAALAAAAGPTGGVSLLGATVCSTLGGGAALATSAAAASARG